MSDEIPPTQSDGSQYLDGLLDDYHDQQNSNDSHPDSPTLGSYEPGPSPSRAPRPSWQPLINQFPVPPTSVEPAPERLPDPPAPIRASQPGLEPLTNLHSAPPTPVEPAPERLPDPPAPIRASQPGLEPLTNLHSAPPTPVEPAPERLRDSQMFMNPRPAPVPPVELPAWEPAMDRLPNLQMFMNPRPAPHAPPLAGTGRNPLSQDGLQILNRVTGNRAPAPTASTAQPNGRHRLQKPPPSSRGRAR